VTLPEHRRVVAIVVTWRTPIMTTRLLRHLVTHWPDMAVVLVECGPEYHDLTDLKGKIVVLRCGNLGYAGGNNLGIRQALQMGATHVLVLNSDAFPLPGCVEALVQVLEDHPGAASTGGTLVRWHPGRGPELNSGTSFDWTTGRTSPTPIALQGRPIDFACGAMLLIRAEALRVVGGFDSRFFLFYEEIDWAERARQHGYHVTSTPAARALHLGTMSVATARRAVVFYSSRNRLIVLRRYAGDHGVGVSASREVKHLARVLAGHVARGRLWALVPALLGTFEGIRASLAVDDTPETALAQQCWETRRSP
jgi:GT2 family glycosyltransferase